MVPGVALGPRVLMTAATSPGDEHVERVDDTQARPTRRQPLSHEATDALLRQYAASAAKHGAQSPEAVRVRNRIVEGHLGLIFVVWTRYRLRVAHEDALGIGTPGLIKAVERFDLARRVRFSTYAIWWIRHALCRTAQNECNTVRVPVHLQGRQSREKAECREAAEAARRVSSLDVLTDDSRETYANTFEDADALEAFEAIDADGQAAELGRAVATLDARLRKVLNLRSQDLTRDEIAARHGISRERVRQLEGEALGRLRRTLGA